MRIQATLTPCIAVPMVAACVAACLQISGLDDMRIVARNQKDGEAGAAGAPGGGGSAGSCIAVGEGCTQLSECCSQSCKPGPNGDVCWPSSDSGGGAGASGASGSGGEAGSCTPTGWHCANNAECCSNWCLIANCM
jgi:hypothetical protein